MKWSKFIKFMWLSVGSMPCWMPVALETRRGPSAVCLSPTSSLASSSILEDTVFEKTATGADETLALTKEDHRAIQESAREHQFGEYKVVGKLGKGGMGEVYEAVHPAKEKPLAIKTLSAAVASNPEMVNRFKVEALVLAQLSVGNSSIVRLHEWSQDPVYHLVMDKLEGKNLEEILREKQKSGERALPTKQVIEIGIQAARALQFVHTTPVVDFAGGEVTGIVHRDVKPANLFWENGRVVLTDFGLARLPGVEEDSDVVMGTPAYMPPEQWGGADEVDARTDVYALGAVLFYLANGHTAYKATSAVKMMTKIENQQMEKFQPWVPEELKRIIRKAMAYDPDDRYQTAQEMADALLRMKYRPKNCIAPLLQESNEELVELAA